MNIRALSRAVTGLGIWLISASRVLAEELPTYEDTGVVTIGSLEVLFANIVRVIISLSGLTLFLMFISGGFTFLFSGGDQKKLEQARGTISNAVVGLVVIVSAYLIIRIIGTLTGTSNLITRFEILP